MTKRILLLSLLAGLIAALAAFSPTSAPVQDDEDTQLGLYMQDINKTLRKLRSALRDPDRNSESSADIRALQLLVVKARGEKPVMLKDVPEDERAAFTVQYQKQMVAFHRMLLDLEITVLDGDNEAAQAQWKEVSGVKSKAHEVFKVKD